MSLVTVLGGPCLFLICGAVSLYLVSKDERRRRRRRGGEIGTELWALFSDTGRVRTATAPGHVAQFFFKDGRHGMKLCKTKTRLNQQP
jgi:hypothetical protein